MTTPMQLRWGTGFVPSPKDPRDRSLGDPRIRQVLEGAKLYKAFTGKPTLPRAVDLRPWCPAVVFQGKYNTCAAHVVAELLEYFERRAFGHEVTASRLFLYKVAKNFLGQTGDPGVYIRQVMGVLRILGAPPEKYWPYPDPGTIDDPKSGDPVIDAEPSAFCYALAQGYRAVSYYRLDDGSDRVKRPTDLLALLKAHLAGGLPVTLGFPLYPSLAAAETNGKIPFPAPSEKELGSHAVVAAGYDDRITVKNTAKDGRTTRGALLILNTWSTGWGEQGCGWLPYAYVTRGLARDLWTLLRAEWVTTGKFQLEL